LLTRWFFYVYEYIIAYQVVCLCGCVYHCLPGGVFMWMRMTGMINIHIVACQDIQHD